MKKAIKRFKELNWTEQLFIVCMVIIMIRMAWPLVQIMYVLICNIIELHG